MTNRLTRIEVSVSANWSGNPTDFQKRLAQRLPGLVAELAEATGVTPNRIQVVGNPKK